MDDIFKKGVDEMFFVVGIYEKKVDQRNVKYI